MEQTIQAYLLDLPESAQVIKQPELFTYPFLYQPHPLAKIAAEALQKNILMQAAFIKTYGSIKETGKMFGVLIVESYESSLNYLAAFSGKLGEETLLPPFVPPVFDTRSRQHFYIEEEAKISALNRRIDTLLHAQELLNAKKHLDLVRKESEETIASEKEAIRQNKVRRDLLRAQNHSNDGAEDWESKLNRESKEEQLALKRLRKDWDLRIKEAEESLAKLILPIESLKKQRKQMSISLQQRLFSQYSFLNSKGQSASLTDIFKLEHEAVPPSGSGECAAPKLLHFAFRHGLRPICMAEFWWGAPPPSEVRKHGHYYPACKSKCKPILSHMLEGLKVEPSPILRDETSDPFQVLYEDDDIMIIDKAEGILSVPGKSDLPSIYSLLKAQYPHWTGPLMVHRLDMATSGLMLIAKHEEAYWKLQNQFAERSIQKQYVALLDGHLEGESGQIDLPLRVDLDNRPAQLVCYEHGKAAKTIWQKVAVSENKTRVNFFPVTGRTHQLRVHAAHHQGLNAPIIGDDIYGKKDKRLFLHAERIKFTHPISGKNMRYVSPCPF